MFGECTAGSAGFAIGALAQRTGCSIDTIRYYERIGLMPDVRRSEGGHRLYSMGHMRRLAFVRRSRALGLSLDQVGRILGGVERSGYSCAEVRALLSKCAEGARRRIEELQNTERNLRQMVETCGNAELASCQIIEAMLSGEDIAVGSRCCTERESPLI